jgi:threonine synthase
MQYVRSVLDLSAIAIRATAGASAKQSPCGIFFQTAHPTKFKVVVEEETGQRVDIPERLASCLSKQKSSIKIPESFDAFQEQLLR